MSPPSSSSGRPAILNDSFENDFRILQEIEAIERAESLNHIESSDDDIDAHELEQINAIERQYDVSYNNSNNQEPMETDEDESELDTTFINVSNEQGDVKKINLSRRSNRKFSRGFSSSSDVSDSDSDNNSIFGSDNLKDFDKGNLLSVHQSMTVRQLQLAKTVRREPNFSMNKSQRNVPDCENLRRLMFDHYSFSQAHVMDYESSLVAPRYHSSQIPHNAPRRFISAREFLEMSQRNESQMVKPLNEEIEVNDFVVSLQREHDYNENEEEPMQIDDEAIKSHCETIEDFESLDQSLKELTEKIELDTSLKCLSQKLDNKIVEYAENAVKSLEKTAQDLLKIKAIKEMRDKLNNADLGFNTQEYEDIIIKHCSQVQLNAHLVNIHKPLAITGTNEKELTREERAELGRKLYYEKLREIENAKVAREFDEFNTFKKTFDNTNKAGTSTGGYTTTTTTAKNPQIEISNPKKSLEYSSDSSIDEEVLTQKNKKEQDRFGSEREVQISDVNIKQKFVDTFEQSIITNNNNQPKGIATTTTLNGFSFASGKQLFISENVAAKVMKKFDKNLLEIANETFENSAVSEKNIKVSDNNIKNSKNNSAGFRFTFASGKDVKFSNKTAEMARKKFAEHNDQIAANFDKNLQIINTTAELAKLKFESNESNRGAGTSFGGFSFASGKNLKISDKNVENYKRKFYEAELSDDSSKENDSKKPNQTSVPPSDTTSKRKSQDTSQNSSQKSICCSNSSFLSLRSRTKSKTQNNLLSDESFNSSSSSKSQSFLSLRSKRLKTDHDPFASLQTSKITNKSSEILQDSINCQNIHSKIITRSQTRDDPFSSTKPVNNSTNIFKASPSLRKSQPKTEVDPFQSPLPPKRPKISQSPIRQKFNVQKPQQFAPRHASSPIVTNSPSIVTFKAKKSMEIQSPIVPDNLFELLDEIKPNSKPKKKQRAFDYSKYRLNNLKSNENKEEAPTTPVRSVQPFRTNWKRKVKDMTLSQRLRDFDAVMALDPEMSLSQYDQVKETEAKEFEKIKAEKMLNKMRRDELEKLKQYIESKPVADTKPLQGICYNMRQDKIETQDNFEEVVYRNVIDIKNNEINAYKFDVKNLLTSDDDLFVIVADNAKLVIGENFKVGFEEIKMAFLSSPGIDPKLLHQKWIENAYELIGAKLVWMENNFKSFEGTFAPENLLIQLKYHYDREIDLNERSAIRKITELDDVPQRRMILKVHEIFFLPDRGYELEMTDGWYKIRVTVDKCLANAIDEKEIEIHTKLVISNAILINPTQRGYHPLDLPDTIKLKISGNSTRVANIDSTLGYCKYAVPFQVPLDSISGEGGVIGMLRVYITHVYALVYVSSDAENKKSKKQLKKNFLDNFFFLIYLDFRSEKMQRRIEAKNEMIFTRLFTEVYEKVLKEYREEIKERVFELKMKNFSDYSIEDICKILEYDQHDSYFCNDLWNKMSEMQKSQVEVYQNELKQKLRDSTLKRMEMIEQNKVVSMLKFRVVDEDEPKNTAIVNWYQPSDSLLGSVKVGKIIEMSGAIALPTTDEMFIYATNKVNYVIGDAENEEKYQRYLRQETKMSEIKVNEFKPPHDQFDIACMIVRIGEKLDQGYQPIYVVDEHKNFLEIKFVPNITEHAYDNLLKVGVIFFIRDLQWYNASSEKNPLIPTSCAISDTTVFTINPRKEDHRMRLEELRTNINDNYKRECIEKLEELLPTKMPLKITPEDNPQLAKRFVFRHYGKPCGARRFHF